MKKVSKEDYEVLSRYHYGEIRYYIDFDGDEPKGRGRNWPVALTNRKGHKIIAREGSIKHQVHEAVLIAFEGEEKVWGRADLVEWIAGSTELTHDQVSPAISALITDGALTYS